MKAFVRVAPDVMVTAISMGWKSISDATLPSTYNTVNPRMSAESGSGGVKNHILMQETVSIIERSKNFRLFSVVNFQISAFASFAQFSRLEGKTTADDCHKSARPR
jgi:hypothetical protein